MCHGRTVELATGIAPILLVLRIAKPEIGNTDATGEADHASDDQQLPVPAVVHLRQRAPPRWVTASNLHSGAGTLTQYVGEVVTDSPRPVYERFKGDGTPDRAACPRIFVSLDVRLRTGVVISAARRAVARIVTGECRRATSLRFEASP